MLFKVKSLCMCFFVTAIIFSLNIVAFSSEWKPKEITILITDREGGGQDVRSRTWGNFIKNELPGTNVKYEYSLGAGGAAGMSYLLRQLPADGTVLVSFVTPTHNVASLISGIFRIEDLSLLGGYSPSYRGVLSLSDGPYKSLKDLYIDAKKRPGEIPIGYFAGSDVHLLMEIFLDTTGIKLRKVPYDGGSASRLALIGGHTQLDISPTERAWQDFPKEFHTLFIFEPERVSIKPDVPTFQEVIKEMDPSIKVPSQLINGTSFCGMAVPRIVKDKYPERYKLLSDVFKKISVSKDFENLAMKRGFTPGYQSPEKFMELTNSWGEAVNKYSHLFKRKKK